MLSERPDTKEPSTNALDPPSNTDVEKKDGEPQSGQIPLAQANGTDELVYPSGWRLALLLSAVFASMFLVSLV